MELVRCLNSAKRFQSLAFTFLFLTLSCKILCIIFEFGILQNSKKPLDLCFFLIEVCVPLEKSRNRGACQFIDPALRPS